MSRFIHTSADYSTSHLHQLTCHQLSFGSLPEGSPVCGGSVLAGFSAVLRFLVTAIDRFCSRTKLSISGLILVPIKYVGCSAARSNNIFISPIGWYEYLNAAFDSSRMSGNTDTFRHTGRSAAAGAPWPFGAVVCSIMSGIAMISLDISTTSFPEEFDVPGRAPNSWTRSPFAMRLVASAVDIM
eukprot:3135967-Amphidinium_carterae.2